MSIYSAILKYFLRLGILGFGGPLALVSSMQRDLVLKEKWITEEEFNSAFSLIKALPGTIAFMTAVYLGRVRGGLIGGTLAGFGLIFPAFVLMIIFSIFLKEAQNIIFVESILQGMQVCALGVILGSLKGLVKTNMKSFLFWVLVIFSGAINYYRPELEPIVILSFGGFFILYKKYEKLLFSKYDLSLLVLIFLVSLKAGALVFGSGLAIVPMLKHDVVYQYHWLSEKEFLNALAFGQMTPGPVVITATYIGHHVLGMKGAIVSTIGMFIASFFHMMTWFPYVIKKLQGKIWIKDFLFGAVAAVVGPIIVAVIKLYFVLEFSYVNLVFLILAFILTLKSKIPLWAIIPTGGMMYYLFYILNII